MQQAIKVARQNGVPVPLFLALVHQESRWDPGARSGAGAQGLTQLMPGTAGGLGVRDPFDPLQNLTGGAKYLREQLDQFGTAPLALSAYNSGPGGAESSGLVEAFRETQDYVKAVQALEHQYRRFGAGNDTYFRAPTPGAMGREDADDMAPLSPAPATTSPGGDLMPVSRRHSLLQPTGAGSAIGGLAQATAQGLMAQDQATPLLRPRQTLPQLDTAEERGIVPDAAPTGAPGKAPPTLPPMGPGGGRTVYYSQGDARWADFPYGGKNLASSGCGPATMATIISSLTGKQVTPPDVAKWAGSRYYVPGVGSSWQLFPDAAGAYGLKYQSLGKDLSAAAEVLRNGGMIVAAGSGNFFGRHTNGHILTIRGIDKKGNFYVADSAGRDGKRAFTPQEVMSGLMSLHAINRSSKRARG